MRKFLVLLISMVALGTATFAQNGYDRRGSTDRYGSPYYKEGYNSSKDRYDEHKHGRYDNDRYKRERRAEWERINRDYDNRIRDYRNDRRMSNYERNRRIQELERERQQKANSFGKGLAIGGIAGVLLGVLIGR